MSTHDWTKENLDAYQAGGLTTSERQNVEQHIESCPECAEALAESRELEKLMDDLFVEARPDAALEQRAIAKLRRARITRANVLRLSAAAAAVLVLGLIGATVQAIAIDGPRYKPVAYLHGVAQNDRSSTLEFFDASKSMGREATGIDFDDEGKKNRFYRWEDTNAHVSGKKEEAGKVPNSDFSPDGRQQASAHFNLRYGGVAVWGLPPSKELSTKQEEKAKPSDAKVANGNELLALPMVTSPKPAAEYFRPAEHAKQEPGKTPPAPPDALEPKVKDQDKDKDKDQPIDKSANKKPAASESPKADAPAETEDHPHRHHGVRDRLLRFGRRESHRARRRHQIQRCLHRHDQQRKAS